MIKDLIKDNYIVLEILVNYLLNTNNKDDIDILIKLSTLSKDYYNFLSKRLLNHKAYIRSRLKYLPIIQPSFYKYSFKQIPDNELYTPSTLIKYFKRSELTIDEIVDFNVYLILNCKEYCKSVNVSNNWSVYGINKTGRIIQLPTSEGYVGSRSNSNILNGQIIMRVRKNTDFLNKKMIDKYIEIDIEQNLSTISEHLKKITDQILIKLNEN